MIPPGISVRRARQILRDENRQWPLNLVEVPRDDWPAEWRNHPKAPAKALRSRNFLVQIYAASGGVTRLSICRTDVLANGRSVDGIAWDQLQAIKAEAGFAECTAIEIFPPDQDIVNVANMRHLWVLPEALPFQWNKGGAP